MPLTKAWVSQCPAICSGCQAKSKPRPLGHTPDGWCREKDGQGSYWCGDCSGSAAE